MFHELRLTRTYVLVRVKDDLHNPVQVAAKTSGKATARLLVGVASVQALVRPLVDAAGPLARMALAERHEPQVDVGSPSSWREHEAERAGRWWSSPDRDVDLVQPLQSRAVASLLQACTQLWEVNARLFELRAFPFGGNPCR